APDDDRRADLPLRHEIIERDAEARTIPLPQPANARGQPLELNLLASELDPATQMGIVGKELDYQLVGTMQIAWITGQRHPTKWTLAFAEKRPDVLRNE